MGLKSSLENILGEVFGYETKVEKQARLEEEQKSPTPKDQQKPASEKEKKEKEREWADVTESVKFVCKGGKIQCTFCATPIADILPTSTQVMLQDKPYVTVGDNNGKVNFDFKGVCTHPSQGSNKPPCKAVISLGQWKDYSETMIDNYNALLVKSTIPCMISGQDLKIVHSGQMAELAEVKPKIKRNPQIIESYWVNEDGERIEKIAPNKYATLVIKTKDYRRKDELKIKLPINGEDKTFVTHVNSKGIAILKNVYKYESINKNPRITKMYWIDNDTQEIIEIMQPNQRARLCFETENIEEGKKVKARVKFANGVKFGNGSTQLVFSGIVNKNGIAISEQVCENS
jgi:hypothetical protein